MLKVKETKAQIESLKIEKMDIAETEETMLSNILFIIISNIFTK